MASFILYSKNSFEKVDRHVIFMICMACTPWPYIYIYTHILYIHTSYHVYLYILHIYPNFIAFRWFVEPSSQPNFGTFKVASNWSTDPQAWRMFNSRPRRTLAAWKLDGCDVFFFHAGWHFSQKIHGKWGMSGWMSQFSRCAIFPVGQAGLYPFLTCPSPNW